MNNRMASKLVSREIRHKLVCWSLGRLWLCQDGPRSPSSLCTWFLTVLGSPSSLLLVICCGRGLCSLCDNNTCSFQPSVSLSFPASGWSEKPSIFSSLGDKIAEVLSTQAAHLRLKPVSESGHKGIQISQSSPLAPGREDSRTHLPSYLRPTVPSALRGAREGRPDRKVVPGTVSSCWWQFAWEHVSHSWLAEFPLKNSLVFTF